MAFRSVQSLDNCIDSIFEPGNPGNATDSGTITVPRFPIDVEVSEAAAATDSPSASLPIIYDVSVSETAAAAAQQDGSIISASLSRSAMVAGLGTTFVNPSASRDAYVDGVMINVR
jgi:hypothetical protein